MRAARLREALDISRLYLPCYNTCRRVLSEAVDVAQLQGLVSELLTQRSGAGESVLIAIDGKTLRASIPPGQTRGIHLRASFAVHHGGGMRLRGLSRTAIGCTVLPTLLAIHNRIPSNASAQGKAPTRMGAPTSPVAARIACTV